MNLGPVGSLDELVGRMAALASTEESIGLLVDDLAARIKATSNDQNIQRLSRDLKGVKAALVRAVIANKTQSTMAESKAG